MENPDAYRYKTIGLSGDKLTIQQYCDILSKHLSPRQFQVCWSSFKIFAHEKKPGHCFNGFELGYRGLAWVAQWRCCPRVNIKFWLRRRSRCLIIQLRSRQLRRQTEVKKVFSSAPYFLISLPDLTAQSCEVVDVLKLAKRSIMQVGFIIGQQTPICGCHLSSLHRKFSKQNRTTIQMTTLLWRLPCCSDRVI